MTLERRVLRVHREQLDYQDQWGTWVLEDLMVYQGIPDQ